jgi:multidrug efflux pump subunit AcrA (membrane-fusion protein)
MQLAPHRLTQTHSDSGRPVALSFDTSGTIAWVLPIEKNATTRPVRPGDTVKQGCVLARLDDALLRRQSQMAVLKLERAFLHEQYLQLAQASTQPATAPASSRPATAPTSQESRQQDLAFAEQRLAEMDIDVARAELDLAHSQLGGCILRVPAGQDMTVLASGLRVGQAVMAKEPVLWLTAARRWTTEYEALAVPRLAATGRAGVFIVVNENGRDVARLRPVDLGAAHGQLVALGESSEVKAGDRVVIEGMDRLEDGWVVHAQPGVQTQPATTQGAATVPSSPAAPEGGMQR